VRKTMINKPIFYFSILPPSLLVIFLAGCFPYNPDDLTGFDTAVDDEPDTSEMDTSVDREPDGADVEVDPADVPDVPHDGDAETHDVPTEDIGTEDIESEDFEIDWDVPATCGNGVVEPPDEDCDGDEPGTCTTECGTEGASECIGCRWVCFPPPDNNCNGVDEDCDTIPDDGYVPTHTCGTGVCENDSSCVDGTETCDPLPPRSSDDLTCDGLDDDCDGATDDDYVPYVCGTGVCEQQSTCVDGVEECSPGTPTGIDDDCDGLDNNCNGVCDENYTTTDTCGTGPCERFYQCNCGTEFCNPGTPISPSDTTCNNVDDDCDGAVDDDYVPTTCGHGVCQRQSTCVDGVESCTPGSATGTDEDCNGIDEDCDGIADDGYPPFICGVGACQRQSTCIGGIEDCQPGTPAPAEICVNGIDDDCNGLVDDGCGSTCTPCPGSIDALSPNPTGGRFTGTTTGPSEHAGGSCANGNGPEVFYHFTLLTASDVFITTHGSSFDTVVYVKECDCDGPEIACNNDADGLTTSVIHLRDLAAGAYNIFVDGRQGTDQGDYQLHVYATDPGLEGDRCGDPIYLTSAGYEYSSPNDTCNLSRDYEPYRTGDCGTFVGTGNAEEMVFYFWVPSDGTTIMFSTCDSLSLTFFDTALYLRYVCNNPSASNQVDCAEDIRCGPGDSFRRLTELTVTLDAGLYYLMVDGYAQEPSIPYSCGEYILTVSVL